MKKPIKHPRKPVLASGGVPVLYKVFVLCKGLKYRFAESVLAPQERCAVAVQS